MGVCLSLCCYDDEEYLYENETIFYRAEDEIVSFSSGIIDISSLYIALLESTECVYNLFIVPKWFKGKSNAGYLTNAMIKQYYGTRLFSYSLDKSILEINGEHSKQYCLRCEVLKRVERQIAESVYQEIVNSVLEFSPKIAHIISFLCSYDCIEPYINDIQKYFDASTQNTNQLSYWDREC